LRPSFGAPNPDEPELRNRYRFSGQGFRCYGFNVDMAAKRHKKHKYKISEFVISVGYNE
jgi:hypothetical protein